MGQGIHYYSERTMVIHDENCDLLINYNPDEGHKGNPKKVFMFSSIFFVNLWNIRNKKRLQEKDKYIEFRSTQRNNTENCKFKNTLEIENKII